MNEGTVKDADSTTIPIRKVTRDRLRSLGRMDETYSDFIERLLDMYEDMDRRKK